MIPHCRVFCCTLVSALFVFFVYKHVFVHLSYFLARCLFEMLIIELGLYCIAVNILCNEMCKIYVIVCSLV